MTSVSSLHLASPWRTEMNWTPSYWKCKKEQFKYHLKTMIPRHTITQPEPQPAPTQSHQLIWSIKTFMSHVGRRQQKHTLNYTSYIWKPWQCRLSYGEGSAETELPEEERLCSLWNRQELHFLTWWSKYQAEKWTFPNIINEFEKLNRPWIWKHNRQRNWNVRWVLQNVSGHVLTWDQPVEPEEHHSGFKGLKRFLQLSLIKRSVFSPGVQSPKH